VLQKIVIGIIGAWVVILIASAAYIWSAAQPSPVQDGLLQREAGQQVFWGEGQTTITVTHAARPNFACSSKKQTVNIALLLDKSSSMNGIDAFNDATQAAQVFLNVVDLDRTQVALAFFDEEVIPKAIGFSQDIQIISQSFEGIVADGEGTSIANALQVAGDALRQQQQIASNAGSAIVLLSDGNANNDRAKTDLRNAIAIANQLKQENVRIITVALGDAEAVEKSFLAEVSTSPSDAYITAAPDQLQGIYENIANELNTAVGLDVVYTESIHPDLIVNTNVITPPAEYIPESNQLQWQLPQISKEGTIFNYDVTAPSLGRYELNPTESTMSYTGCIAGAVTLPLAAGPTLLVLPSPMLATLIALLPLLILLIVMFWKRRKLNQDPLPVAPPSDAAREPKRIGPPTWLTRLTEIAVLAQSNANRNAGADMSPTVIIGLGITGRTVLDQMAQTLKNRAGGGSIPQVRLLQIDIEPKNAKGVSWKKPPHLDEDEWVLLRPDLREMVSFLKKEQGKSNSSSYLDWYDPFLPSGRMQGRMALFYDLRRGTQGSTLWSSLEKALHQLDSPNIKVVGSTFDDGSSGLLVDITRLAQIVIAGSNPQNSNVDVEMWLTGPVKEDWSPEIMNGKRKIRYKDQQTRTLATLRELERFQRNARQPFQYVADSNSQDQLRSTTHSAVVQTIFLFEPKSGTISMDDHLNTISDGLLATLHDATRQEMVQHLTATQRQASLLANERHMGTVCSLGAYAVRLPLGILQEATAWRVAYDLLFDNRIGLQPCREQQTDGDYNEVFAEQMIPDDPRARRESAEAIIDAFISNLDSRGFMQAVARHVNTLLNGEQGEHGDPVRDRRGGLLQAQKWLESLRGMVQQEGEREVAKRITELSNQVAQWQTFLQDKIEPFVESKRQETRQQLAELLEQKGRQWVLSDSLEWDLYRQRIRGSQGDYQTLARAAKRFGWHVQYHDRRQEWQCDFLVPPTTLVWDEDVYLPDHVVQAEIGDFTQAIYQVSTKLAQGSLKNETVFETKRDSRAWLSQAAPGLVQAYGAAQDISSSEIVLMVSAESVHTDQLRGELENNADGLPIRLCNTTDQTALTLLRVQGHMPLSFYERYTDEAWETNYVDKNLYVWRGEQIASDVERESNGARLDLQFVGWLQQDRPLVDLFCEGYLFGLWDHQNDEWFLPGLGSWSATGMGDALENLLGDDTSKLPVALTKSISRPRLEALQELKAEISDRKKTINDDGGVRPYYREIRKDHLPRLTVSKDSRERNLAIYLTTFLD
jgi:Mg-chelatase subunit ChlD